MKIRQGFVSNSSSSSFIIAFKKGLTEKQIESKIVEKLKIPQDSPIFWLAGDIAKVFTNYQDIDFADYEEEEDYIKNIRKLESKGFVVYEGSASNDDYDVAENLVCDMELYIDEPDLYISKGGGY